MDPSILAERLVRHILFLNPGLAKKIQQIEDNLAYVEQQRQAQMLAEFRERQQRITILERHLPKAPHLWELFDRMKHSPRWVQYCWEACVGRNGTITPKKFLAVLRVSQLDLSSTRIPYRPGAPLTFASRDEARKKIIEYGREVVADGHTITQERVAAKMRYEGRDGLTYHLKKWNLDWKADIRPAIKSPDV